MSDEMKYREKVECFSALESISYKINERDADMRSHIVLSMFKVAAAEANVPEAPPVDAVPSLQAQLPLILLAPLLLVNHGHHGPLVLLTLLLLLCLQARTMGTISPNLL